MPRYFFHLMLGPRMVARDNVGHECPNDAAAHEFARLSAGLFVSDLLLLGTFEQYCFEVVSEDGETIAPSSAG